MAAAVNENKLLTHELKAQVQAVAVEIGADRARELQVTQQGKTDTEKRYVRLFLVMESRGLAAACIPEPTSVRSIRPIARLKEQQHHPQINSKSWRFEAPHPVIVPVMMKGNH